ncbi:hypothetical protein F2Q68_00032215 [Brassica cretica]|uniref:Uncharacterized protein n=1 Tax=Brassica cretica TaxID=69181 RepID=A0A8S9GFI5_BRACR|nr:hypothetical protein F2Q68_00032215 [Brassica cretica]
MWESRVSPLDPEIVSGPGGNVEPGGSPFDPEIVSGPGGHVGTQSNWKYLEALWLKKKRKMMLVRVQASTTRVEPTRVPLPASRRREEPNEELQRGLERRGVEYPLARTRRIIGNPARGG